MSLSSVLTACTWCLPTGLALKIQELRCLKSPLRTRVDSLHIPPHHLTHRSSPHAQLDLASLDSVRLFAESFKALGRPLHILVNNAGVMACPYDLTQVCAVRRHQWEASCLCWGKSWGKELGRGAC